MRRFFWALGLHGIAADNIQKGEYGEWLAGKYLRKKGYLLIAENWRSKRNHRLEIDLIFRDQEMLVFDFLGKDSMRYYNEVKVPTVVYNIIKSSQLKPLNGKMVEKDSKEDLFDLINAGKLNDFLKTFMPDLSAKVFRTYNASVTLETQLKNKG